MKDVTALSIARRFVGLEEVEGHVSNPMILAMLRLDNSWPADDSVPWCSAFASYVAWLLDLPRSKSLAARSWLLIGRPVNLEDAKPGFDVVILKRGANQPGPEVILGAPGHVGYFDHLIGMDVAVVGGNQDDSVTEARFPRSNVLGVRRLS